MCVCVCVCVCVYLCVYGYVNDHDWLLGITNSRFISESGASPFISESGASLFILESGAGSVQNKISCSRLSRL